MQALLGIVWKIVSPLVRRYWYVLVISALLIIGYFYWRHVQREIGAQAAQAQLLTSELAATTHSRDSLAKVFRTDTLVTTRLLVRWDSTRTRQLQRLVDSLQHLPPTVRVDTLTVQLPATTVLLADSTIRSCQRVLQDCAAQLRTDSLLIRSWQEKAQLVPPAPGVMQNTFRGILWGAAGLGIGLLIGRTH